MRRGGVEVRSGGAEMRLGGVEVRRWCISTIKRDCRRTAAISWSRGVAAMEVGSTIRRRRSWQEKWLWFSWLFWKIVALGLLAVFSGTPPKFLALLLAGRRRGGCWSARLFIAPTLDAACVLGRWVFGLGT